MVTLGEIVEILRGSNLGLVRSYADFNRFTHVGKGLLSRSTKESLTQTGVAVINVEFSRADSMVRMMDQLIEDDIGRFQADLVRLTGGRDRAQAKLIKNQNQFFPNGNSPLYSDPKVSYNLLMEKMTKRERKEQKKAEYQEVLKKQKMNDMLKKFGIWGGAAAILIASVWGLFVLSTTTPSATTGVEAPAISNNDITIGSSSAQVSLVEYSDFQCPACAAYHPIVNQLLAEFEGKLKLAYRFFPLSQTHKNAMISAQAGYAAFKQNKFEDMYNMLLTPKMIGQMRTMRRINS